MYLQLYVVLNYRFKEIKLISSKRVSELKKHLQSVLRTSVAKSYLLDLSVKALELAIKLISISEAVKSVWTSARAQTYAGRQ